MFSSDAEQPVRALLQSLREAGGNTAQNKKLSRKLETVLAESKKREAKDAAERAAYHGGGYRHPYFHEI